MREFKHANNRDWKGVLTITLAIFSYLAWLVFAYVSYPKEECWKDCVTDFSATRNNNRK